MLGSLVLLLKQLLDQVGDRLMSQGRQDKDLNFIEFGKTISREILERRNEEGQVSLSQGQAVLLGPVVIIRERFVTRTLEVSKPMCTSIRS